MRGATLPPGGYECRIVFQSTRPMRGATHDLGHRRGVPPVSIHAPRVGRDGCLARHLPALNGFNPRAPCGARPVMYDSQSSNQIVSIHAPRVGRDKGFFISEPRRGVSIHAPRVGRDTPALLARFKVLVSIHAPRVGRDCRTYTASSLIRCFNPRAPCGARQVFQYFLQVPDVSIHAPRVGRDGCRVAAP